ncbi:hypothetical protein [Brucella rhizosphaerae]|uniref:hypothetical protein n=1 Tax=Brucella rhizosphaerae TaxID=571254 RepID=UPI0036195D72
MNLPSHCSSGQQPAASSTDWLDLGTALLSLGIWLQVLPPWQAVAIAAAMSVISGGQGLWAIRENLWPARKRLVRFLLPYRYRHPSRGLGVALH